MNVDVTSEIDINRPRQEVSAFASSPDHVTAWYRNITAVRWESVGPLQIGSRITFEASFLGRRLAYTYQVRELEAGVRLVMSTDEGPFPMETTYLWRDNPDGTTHMTLRNRGEPAGFASLAAPLIATQMRRATRRDLKLLKSLLEAQPGA